MRPIGVKTSILISAAAFAAGAAIGLGLLDETAAQERTEAAATTRPTVVGKAPAIAPDTKPSAQAAASSALPATEPAVNGDEKLAGPGPSAAPATNPAAEPTSGPAAKPATAPTATPETHPATRPGEASESGSSSRNSRSGSSSKDRDRASDRSGSNASAANPPSSNKLDGKYEALVVRSLFSKTRPIPPSMANRVADVRPSQQPTPPAPEKSMAVRGMSIEGEGDGDCYAFIEDLPLRQMMRVKVGDSIARGKIAEVTLADLVYEYNGTRTRVSIGHTLDGSPAPAVTWTTYTPVAPTPPSGSRGNDPRSSDRSGDSRSGDSRGGDSRGGDSRSSRGDDRGGDSRSGDSRGGDSRSSRGGGDNEPAAAPPAPGVSAATSPSPAAPTPPATAGPGSQSPAPGTPAAGSPAPVTPAPGAPAAGAPAPGAPAGGDDLLERMRRRREQEAGR